MYSKADFFYHFYSMALSDKEIYNLKSSVAEILEGMYEQCVKWHKKNDERLYRESLTLEQLYRLDH